MRYLSDDLRDRLAAEYVLGTLAGRARARFAGLLRYDPQLRRRVAQWEARLGPMADALPPVPPPARVWHAIEQRISSNRGARGAAWTSLAFWRGLTAAACALLLAVAVYLASAPPGDLQPSTLAVLADSGQQPVLMVSWPKQKSADKFVTVKLLAQPTVAAGKAWELWMLPGGDRKPISIGLVRTAQGQTFKLSAAAGNVLGEAWGFAVSVEPPGGSPTGQPTGPVILQGRCVKVA